MKLVASTMLSTAIKKQHNSVLPLLRHYLPVFAEICRTALIFTARRYALRGLCDRNSVRPSVRPSVTLVDCVHMVRPTIMVSSPYGSLIILVSADITLIPKLEGVTPSEGVE